LKKITASLWSSTSFTAGGTVYRYGANFINNVNTPNEVDVYFDSLGYAMWMNAPATQLYAIVLRSDFVLVDLFDSATMSELVLSNGSVTTVRTNIVVATPGSIVSYSPAPGIFNLTNLAQTRITTATSVSITGGNARFRWEGTDYTADSNTLYIVRTGSIGNYTYTPYTGFANVPNLSGDATGAVHLGANGAARVVYLENPQVIGATADLVFVYRTPTVMTSTDAGRTYWVQDVLVDGVVQTLWLASNYAVGVYSQMVTDAANITTLNPMPGKVTTPTSGFLFSDDGRVIAGTNTTAANTYTPAADLRVYTFNSTGTGSISQNLTITGLSTIQTTANFFFVSNNAGVITNIFISSPPNVTYTLPVATAASITSAIATVSGITPATTTSVAGGAQVSVSVTLSTATASSLTRTMIVSITTGASDNWIVRAPAAITLPASGSIVASITFVMPYVNIATIEIDLVT
jgi:hypothetical protein